MKNVRKIDITNFLDIIMTSLITLLLIYTGQTIGITIFFQFVPLTVLILRYGYIEFFISFILTLIGSIFIFDLSMTIFIFIYFLIMTLSISYFIKKNNHIFDIAFKLSIISMAVIGIAVVVLNKVYDINVMNELKIALDNSIKPIEEILSDNIEFNRQQIKKYIQSLRDFFKYILKIFPGLLLISGFVTSLTNTLFTIKFLEKIGNKTNYNTNISDYSLGKYILNLLTVIFFIYIFVEIFQLKAKDDIILNLFFISSFLLSLNGVLVSHNILKRMFNKFMSYLIIFIFLILFKGSTIFSILGFIDIFFDFRKRLIIRKRER